MPMNTMLVSSRRSAVARSGVGHSPRSSRATCTWATISAAVRLRTSFCVPVWQKVQFSVQPTWTETHSAPRGRRRGCRRSRPRCPGRRCGSATCACRPCETCRVDDLGPRELKASARSARELLGDVGHRGEVGDAVVVDPAPQLAGAHLARLLGHADAGQRLARPSRVRPISVGRAGAFPAAGRRRAAAWSGGRAGREAGSRWVSASVICPLRRSRPISRRAPDRHRRPACSLSRSASTAPTAPRRCASPSGCSRRASRPSPISGSAIDSIYRWRGALERASEVTLAVRTRAGHFDGGGRRGGRAAPLRRALRSWRRKSPPRPSIATRSSPRRRPEPVPRSSGSSAGGRHPARR